MLFTLSSFLRAVPSDDDDDDDGGGSGGSKGAGYVVQTYKVPHP